MKIHLTEEELKQYISEEVSKFLNESFDNMSDSGIEENAEEEGVWNNLKTGAKTFFSQQGNPDASVSDRWRRAKANYKQQGTVDNYRNLYVQLKQLLDSGKINPNVTVGQLVGGQYNKNRLGRLHSYIGGNQSAINGRM